VSAFLNSGDRIRAIAFSTVCWSAGAAAISALSNGAIHAFSHVLLLPDAAIIRQPVRCCAFSELVTNAVTRSRTAVSFSDDFAIVSTSASRSGPIPLSFNQPLKCSAVGVIHSSCRAMIVAAVSASPASCASKSGSTSLALSSALGSWLSITSARRCSAGL